MISPGYEAKRAKQMEFNGKVAQTIRKEYEQLEANVDPPDRPCSAYQAIRARVIKELEQEHGLKVEEAFLKQEGL
jgi:hypothetical protein